MPAELWPELEPLELGPGLELGLEPEQPGLRMGPETGLEPVSGPEPEPESESGLGLVPGPESGP